MVLALGGGLSFAAGSKKEERAYAAAVGAFNDGMYPRAETEFAHFIENYPLSGHLAEAVLLQAQAEFKQGKLADTIARLTDTNHLAKAGTQADEYFYWTGQAQFQGASYPAAAETWLALAQKFPDSRLRLRAVVEAASAFAKLAEWPQIVALLAPTNGVFGRAAELDAGSELVARGQLLLAQAKFMLKDFAGAAAILQPLLASQTLKPELARQCGLLLYQVKIAAGETEAALAVTTNLLQLARSEKKGDWTAEGVALQAEALEKLNRLTEATSAYQENLSTNAPADRQREAVLKIAELAIAQNQSAVATNALEKFLAQFPDSPSADVALLTLGELNLKDYAATRSVTTTTSPLPEVQRRFDQFIVTFTNSPLLGKAYLDRGWCFWLADKIPESFEDFKTAAKKIAAQQWPPSEELLVAWFKMGDAQFVQKDYAGALENYRAVLDAIKLSPDAGASLGDPALYQILRASLEMNDVAGASNAFAQIFLKHPGDGLLQSSALLYGESLASPGDARALFEKLSAQLAGSPMQPQVALAVARTYEREQNWPAARTNYESWLKDFPTSALQPQVVYALAQASFQAGNEPNAFQGFTNFVAQFPANELAPLAQWWVADHFLRQPDFVNAERNYKFVFEKWPASDLAYPARMMAGRAAMARLDYNGAIRDYFLKLEQDTNCPIDLRVQATFAHGAALMLSIPPDTNSPLANFSAATNQFIQLVQLYPTNEQGALAWFYIGECQVQLGNYDAATNAYAQVISSPAADISARSQAQIGLGIALGKKAALAAGAETTALLTVALDNYLRVFEENEYNLQHGLPADPLWLKKSALQAAPLVGLLYQPEAQKKFYQRLEQALPQLKDLIEQKIAALPPAKN